MKVVVIGGTGLIGTNLVARLAEHGHEAVPAAPSTGVNTLTGEGLKEVLQGADVVVDVSNSPSFADDDVMAFFRTSTGNLTEAAKEAGVGHYVALSVVGTDRQPDVGYFRAKVAQETADHGVGPAVLDRARDPVLRVRRRDRGHLDHRRRGAPAGCRRAADGGRRRVRRRRPDRGRAARSAASPRSPAPTCSASTSGCAPC